MPFNLGLSCFARPTQTPSRAKFGKLEIVKNIFKAPVGIIKKCFGVRPSELATDIEETALPCNYVNNMYVSKETSRMSPAQAAASTVIVSSSRTSRDVANAGPDESATESVYAITITTASVVNSASFIAFAQTTISSAASHTQSPTVNSGLNNTETNVSTAVSNEGPIITFDSNLSSTIHFIDSVGLSIASSSVLNVTSRSVDAHTVAVSSAASNAIGVGVGTTLQLTSVPNQKVSVDDDSRAADELTNQISMELDHQPSSGVPKPETLPSSRSRLACTQPGRLRQSFSVHCPRRQKPLSLICSTSAPQLYTPSSHTTPQPRFKPVMHIDPAQDAEQGTASLLSSVIDGSDVVAMTNYSLTTGWDDPNSLASCKVGEVLVPECIAVYDDSYKGASFTVIATLGRGAFGTVVLAVDSLGREVALKVLPSSDNKGKRAKERASREMEAQISLRHCNSVQLLATFSVESRFFLVLEYARNGSLRDRIARTGGTGLDSSFVARVTLAVASALQELHAKGFVHRDLKPGNIVLGDDDEAKLCDFGICGTIGSNGPCTTYCGTKSYCAPEVDGNRSYDEMVDLWSFGVVIYEMLTGELPFANSGELEMNREFEWPSGSTVDKDASDLVRRLLRTDAAERLPLSEVCTHPWVVRNAS